MSETVRYAIGFAAGVVGGALLGATSIVAGWLALLVVGLGGLVTYRLLGRAALVGFLLVAIAVVVYLLVLYDDGCGDLWTRVSPSGVECVKAE